MQQRSDAFTGEIIKFEWSLDIPIQQGITIRISEFADGTLKGFGVLFPTKQKINEFIIHIAYKDSTIIQKQFTNYDDYFNTFCKKRPTHPRSIFDFIEVRVNGQWVSLKSYLFFKHSKIVLPEPKVF